MLVTLLCAVVLWSSAIAVFATTRESGNAKLTFAPPTLVTSEFPGSSCTAFRSGTTSPAGAVLGSSLGGGRVSRDGGKTFQPCGSATCDAATRGHTHPFVTMPDGTMHDTGSAGYGSFGNGTTSASPNSTIWRVSPQGNVMTSVGPASSFTGLPSSIACAVSDPPGSPGDCMYGAGWSAWAQAARLSDGTFVTSTAAVWLGGHFGVTAEQAGLYM